MASVSELSAGLRRWVLGRTSQACLLFAGAAGLAAAISLARVEQRLLLFGVIGASLLPLLLGLGRAAAVPLITLGFGSWVVVSGNPYFDPLLEAGKFSASPLKVLPGILLIAGTAASFLGEGGATESRVNTPTKLFGAYLLVAIIAGGLAPDSGPALFAAARAFAVLAGAMVVQRMGRPRVLAQVFLVGASVQVVTNLVLGLTQGLNEQDRLGQTIHPNIVSLYGVVLLAWSLHALVNDERRRVNWLWVAGLLGALAVIGLSRSRTGFVAAIVVVAASLAGSRASSERRWGMIYWRLGAAVTAVAVFSLMGSTIAGWILRDSAEVSTLNSRTILWREVLPLIGRRPLIGWGMEALDARPHVFPQGSAVFGATTAHNALLEALLAAGFIGASLWLLGLFALGTRLFRPGLTNGTSDLSTRLGISLWLSTIVFAIPESAAAGIGPGWLLLGALLPLASRQERDPNDHSRGTSTPIAVGPGPIRSSSSALHTRTT